MGQGLDRGQGLTGTTTATQRTRAGSVIGRLARALRGRRWLQLSLLLAAPVGWLVVAYLGALAVMLFNGLWRFDLGAQVVIKELSLSNFKELFQAEVYRTITLRTVGMAAVVTLTTAVLAFPIAFTMAKVAGPRARRFLLVAVLLPLWASYVVKVYAWRTILAEEGVLNWMLSPFGVRGPGTGGSGLIGIWLTLTYLWLPYMILPIYAGLERISDSLIDASSDLGASPFTTFRRVILPLALPAVVAGSIFTFSLTLGDYITPRLVSSSQFIGNVIYDNLGTAGNLPFAAAYAAFPMVIMIVYLLVARRLGAFESL
jgi:putative spermidine/putrescine transport system permease protein